METLFERLLRDVVEVLNNAPREMEKYIIEGLERIDSEMAEEIKKRMFVFDDIAILDGRSIQKVLRKVEMPELAQAVHGAHPAAREKILRNMSERAAAKLKEEIAKVDVDKVAAAQQLVVGIIRALEKEGEITVARDEE